MRIAILDDEPDICEVLQTALQIKGHQVLCYLTQATFFASFPVASATDAPSPFDFLIIDLHLAEGLSGLQVIHQVRTRYPTLPILLISAAPSWELEAARRELSSIHVLGKPFKLSVLLALIAHNDTVPERPIS